MSVDTTDILLSQARFILPMLSQNQHVWWDQALGLAFFMPVSQSAIYRFHIIVAA